MISWRLGTAFGVLALLVLGLIALGVHLVFTYFRTSAVGELQTETRQVERVGAQEVHAEIFAAVGELALSGGATQLLEAEFSYNLAALRPTVEYTVTREAGILAVHHPSVDVLPNLRNIRGLDSKWRVRLNDEVPLTLAVGLGLGQGTIRLEGLNLRGLQMEMGAGNAEIDLRGGWRHSFAVQIEGGLGELFVRLPAKTGVRVHVEQGLSEVTTQGLQRTGEFYINDAWGETPVSIDVTLEAGIGEVRLEVDE